MDFWKPTGIRFHNSFSTVIIWSSGGKLSSLSNEKDCLLILSAFSELTLRSLTAAYSETALYERSPRLLQGTAVARSFIPPFWSCIIRFLYPWLELPWLISLWCGRDEEKWGTGNQLQSIDIERWFVRKIFEGCHLDGGAIKNALYFAILGCREKDKNGASPFPRQSVHVLAQ